jgi:pimeloyl-ACP methyl ester carboxylesterase
MNSFLSVFRSESGEKSVLQAYDAILASWAVEYEEFFIETCLGSTHIIASGPKEAPPVILIHAFYASGVAWYQNIKSLSVNHRVFVIDIVGDPNKSKPFKPIRQLSVFIDWLNDIMNELRIDKADFIGNSYGAFLIANYALNVPQKVRKMVLIGPAGTFLKITPFYIHTFPGGITGFSFFIKHAIKWIENGIELNPEFRNLFSLLFKHGKSAIQVFPAVFTDEQLKSISTPTLLLFGDREVIYDYTLAIKRAELCMQNVKAEIIADANHLTAVANPELTNKAILEFIDSEFIPHSQVVWE